MILVQYFVQDIASLKNDTVLANYTKVLLFI